MNAFTLISVIAILTIGSKAFAQDGLQDDPLTEACFSVEHAIKRLKTPRLTPDRRDNVDTFLEAHFVDVETRSLPMKIYLKHEELREDFTVSEHGEVENFHAKIITVPRMAVICGLMRQDGKIGIIMTPSVQYINRSGLPA